METIVAWRGWKFLGKSCGGFLQALGAIWLLMEVGDHYFVGAQWYEDVSRHLSSRTIFGVAVLYGIIKAWPKPICERIEGTDVRVEVGIGNIFRRKGDLIIGSNTTFDTSMEDGTISRKSIQGQFTVWGIRRRYLESIHHLDGKLDNALVSAEPASFLSRGEKPRGKQKRYEMGTVAGIQVGPRQAMFVAMAHFNADHIAATDVESFLEMLPRLWNGVQERSRVWKLLCPLLGTQFAGLKLPRMVVLREIVRSFVAASRDGNWKICDKLCIVLNPRDVRQGRIDLGDVRQFLRCECAYSRGVKTGAELELTGQPVE